MAKFKILHREVRTYVFYGEADKVETIQDIEAITWPSNLYSSYVDPDSRKILNGWDEHVVEEIKDFPWDAYPMFEHTYEFPVTIRSSSEDAKGITPEMLRDALLEEIGRIDKASGTLNSWSSVFSEGPEITKQIYTSDEQ